MPKRAFAIILLGASLGLLDGRAQAQGFAVGVGAGPVDPQGFETAPWFTAHVQWKLRKNWWIEPEVGYWKKTQTTPGTENSVKDLSLGVNLLYYIPRKRLSYFAGAGLGAHAIRSSFDVRGYDAQSDRQLKQALQLLAGLDYNLGVGLSLFGAFRFDAIADLSQSKVYGGVRVKP